MTQIILIIIASLLGILVLAMIGALILLWIFLKAMAHNEKLCLEDNDLV